MALRASAALAVVSVCGVMLPALGGGPASARVTAAAAGPGRWSQVTPAGTNIIDDIGLARGADGVLHVLWTSDASGNQRIADTPISVKGIVGHTVTIGHFFIATDPDAILTPSGVDALWNGYQSSAPGSPYGTFDATRPRSGGSWTRGTNIPPLSGIPFPGSSVAAATGSDGQPWVAFTGLDSLAVDHFGHPEVEVGPTQCCVYEPGLATDGRTGTTWVAYLSLISHHQGIFARPLTASGKAAGNAGLLPGSATGGNVSEITQRVGMTGRGKGRAGVYVVYLHGYPSPHAFDLARLGPGTAVKVTAFGGFRQEVSAVTVTADPQGRLWVAWLEGNGSSPALFVRRSNLAATAFGSAKRVPLPPGTTTVWKVYMNAQAGVLDLLTLVTRNGSGSNTAYWSTQVLPPK
jgi:hypothetical protein